MDILINIIFIYVTQSKINNQLPIWLTCFQSFQCDCCWWINKLTDSDFQSPNGNCSLFHSPLSQGDWVQYFDLYKKIPEYKLQNFDMTMNEFKTIFWWEWFHRFLGRLIGISFFIPLIYFSFKIKFLKLLNLYFIFTLICFQGFIGWYMVSSGLINRVDVSHFRLSIHLIIAFLILSLILWNFLKVKIRNESSNRLNSFIPFFLLF